MSTADSQVPYRSALVTGASGFLGRHLVGRLLRDGWTVDAVLRRRAAADCFPDHERLRRHQTDRRLARLAEVMQRSRTDVVFHLAARYISEHSPDDVPSLLDGNIVFGALLLEAMAHAGVRRLVTAATVWQNYNQRSYCPVNLYAATKQAFEDILRYYVSAQGFKAVVLAIPDTYGPADPRPKVVTALLRAATTNQPLNMSPGGQEVDLIFSDDVVEAFLKASALVRRRGSAASGWLRKYRLASERPVALRTVAETLGRVLGREVPVIWGARPYRSREVMRIPTTYSILPGWHSQVSLEAGLRRICAEVGLLV